MFNMFKGYQLAFLDFHIFSTVFKSKHIYMPKLIVEILRGPLSYKC